ARLRAVVAKDVAEARRDHGPEAVVHQRPHRVLAGRPGAEVRACQQDRGAGVLRLVEDEVPLVAPLGEEPSTKAGALHALEPLARDDLVGIDVRAFQRYGRARDHAYWFH